MDSKRVTREIKNQIWPVLEREAFDKFAGRSAWRHSCLKIDVVNFQSFSSHHAQRIGCTSFSFSVNLGSYLAFVPLSFGTVTVKDGIPVPQEYECHFRRRLEKSIKQRELKRADTWFIANDGAYLAESVSDALTQIKVRGLPWFERFSSDEEILRTLRDDAESETFGMGAKESPQRHVLLGCAELSLHNVGAGVDHFQIALNRLSTLSFETLLASQLRKQIADWSTNWREKLEQEGV